MESGTVELPDAGLDLRATLESGQTFLWGRDHGRAYGESPATDVGGNGDAVVNEIGGDSGDSSRDDWYWTTAGDDAIRVRVRDECLEWQATSGVDAPAHLRRRLGLDDDLDAVAAAAPDDAVVGRAFRAFSGLRVVREPFFPTLISFICSAQMRVERIYRMQAALRERYGEPVELGGTSYRRYPTPERLADADEAELRELKLGYRAPYVRETARMVATGELTRDGVAGRPYEDARDALTGYVGVGEKVADCVLLFGLGDREAVPLDTWIQTAVEQHFPGCDRGSYAETSRALREHFGPEMPGYVQTYVFHYLRTRGSEEE